MRVYEYTGSGSTAAWRQLGADIDGEAARDHSGWSVSLSADGKTVAIGAYLTGAGHVRVYEVPFAIISPSTAVVPENTSSTTPVYTATASLNATFSLTGTGNDNDKFDITRAGVLTFKSAPDYENAADANTDNVYNIQITATVGTQTTTKDVTITVTNLVEAPVFSSAASASVQENTPTTTTVYTASVGSDTDAVSYSLSASSTAAGTADDDNARFTIDGSSGAIKFVSVPDFENPADANTDNVYNVQITATAGTQSTTKDVRLR